MAAKWLIVPALLFSSMLPPPVGWAAADEDHSSTANDWENPEVVGRNKEPGGCTLMPYPDVETALACACQAAIGPSAPVK